MTRDHIAQWVKGMQAPNASGRRPSAKTVANKHGFLAGALNSAVAAGHIPINPCTGIGLARDDEPHEMMFLTRDQFAVLRNSVTEYWRPRTEFLVASGCRWGRLRPYVRPTSTERPTRYALVARGSMEEAATGSVLRSHPRATGRSTSPGRCSTSSTTPANGCSSTERVVRCGRKDSRRESGHRPSNVRGRQWTKTAYPSPTCQRSCVPESTTFGIPVRAG